MTVPKIFGENIVSLFSITPYSKPLSLIRMFDENAENKAADPQKFFAFSFLVFEPAETECFLCMRGIIGQVYASLTVWRQNGDTKEGAKRKKRPQLLRVQTW